MRSVNPAVSETPARLVTVLVGLNISDPRSQASTAKQHSTPAPCCSSAGARLLPRPT